MAAIFRKAEWNYIALAVILLLVFPLALSDFRLNMVGKYLTFAFVAVGLVLCWGETGILSLGQGIFFGLGGYFMAMFLKLEASGTALPDFMDWNSLEALPWFWLPFHNLFFTIIMIVIVPAATAFVVSWAMFRNRVGGVYFSIVTMALATILSILIIGRQGYTGGINGITNFSTIQGLSIVTSESKLILYYVNACLLLGVVALSRFIINSRLGKLLIAIRDKGKIASCSADTTCRASRLSFLVWPRFSPRSEAPCSDGFKGGIDLAEF